MTRRRGALLVSGAAVAFVLTACGESDPEPTSQDASDDPGASDTGEDLADVSPLCVDGFGYADPTADLDAIENLPAGWPEAPDGAELCLTAGGGGVETASYAVDGDIAAVFDHYTSAVPGLELVSGEESGTGYDTLVGDVDGIGVEVRERDAGTFVLAFAGDVS